MDLYKACAEVSFIIENLDEEDRKKIPSGVIKFFKDNSDKNYEVKIAVDIPLDKQELSDETRAFLYILHKKYLS